MLPPLFASLPPLQVADAFVVTGFVFQVELDARPDRNLLSP